MKSGRYSEPLKKPNLVEKFEKDDEKRKKESLKKEWADGGSFTKDDNPNGLLEESSFTVLFPQYREPYLKENFKLIDQTFKDHTLKVDIDFVKGNISVTTTRETYDPYVIIKGRDIIQLLSRGVSIEQSKRVFEDHIFCEVVKISSFVRNKETFIKRRQRLIGPDGSTLKAIELLTECYVLIQGKTVSVIGNFSGIKITRKIIIDCMKNIHPIYNIKELMIKRELEKNPKLKNENWSKYLPKFKKNTNTSKANDLKKKIKKKMKEKGKKQYTPFPPDAEKSKIDLEIESGVYFLNKEQKQIIKNKEIKKKQTEKVNENLKLRDEIFIAPKENEKGGKKSLKELKNEEKEKKEKKRKREQDEKFKKNKK